MRHPIVLAAFVVISSDASGQGPLPWQVEHRVILSPTLPAFILYQGQHTYGSSSRISNPSAGFWIMSTPAVQPPGVDSVLCDFSGINLFWKSEIDITGMNPRTPFSGVTLLNIAGQAIGSSSGGCGTLHAQFLTSELPPGAPPTVMIVWNHVCYLDCDCDGRINVADFGCFQTKFVAGDPYADCNEDGRLTVADFGCFQTTFVQGGCL